MGWDLGRYYTRSRKVNGRVKREYIGTGPVAELVAEMDAIKREQRLIDVQARRQEKDELTFLDAEFDILIEITNLVARAALRVAGYHQHKRGEWRKYRDHA